MLIAKIDADYRIAIPESLRAEWHVGDEVIVTAEAGGTLKLVPKARALEILERTAGLWQGRLDVSADGVTYVNEIRTGHRLNDLGVASDADGL